MNDGGEGRFQNRYERRFRHLGERYQPAQDAPRAGEAVLSQSLNSTIRMSGRTRAAGPCSRMNETSPSGLAKELSRNAITTPFGPASIFSIGPPAQRLDLHRLQQVLDLGRRRPELVDHLCAERVNFALVVELGPILPPNP